MTFGLKKGRNFCNVIVLNLIWSNQETESFAYRWLHAHVMCDETFIPAFVRAFGVISIICRYMILIS